MFISAFIPYLIWGYIVKKKCPKCGVVCVFMCLQGRVGKKDIKRGWPHRRLPIEGGFESFTY